MIKDSHIPCLHPTSVSDIPRACRRILFADARSAQCYSMPTCNAYEDWGSADPADETSMVQRRRKQLQQARWSAWCKARHVQESSSPAISTPVLSPGLEGFGRESEVGDA